MVRRLSSGQVNENRRKLLQKGSAFLKGNKNTPVSPFLLETQGLYPFCRPQPNKKETAFRLSLWCARRDLKASHQLRSFEPRLGKAGSWVYLRRRSADLLSKNWYCKLYKFQFVSASENQGSNLICGVFHRGGENVGIDVHSCSKILVS